MLGSMNNLANMAVNALQLRDFQVRFIGGQTVNEPIDRIFVLGEILDNYGVEQIAKISFYFQDNENLFHNLILRKLVHENRFVVEFFYTYDNNVRRVDMTTYEQMRDFATVINMMVQAPHLNNLLMPLIINPFLRQQLQT